MKKTRKRESGRSMIEMVGVLAITGLLTAGAFVLITSGMASQKRRRAFDEVQTLAQTVRALTAEAEKFDQLPAANDTVRYNGGHKLAQNLLKSGGTSPFGENTYYVVTKSDAEHNNNWYSYFGLENTGSVLFRIGVMNMEEDECLLLAQEAWNGVAADASCVSGTAWFYFGK